jgi:predicted phosphodiesterase
MTRYLVFLGSLLLPSTGSAAKILIVGDPQYGWHGTAACVKERAYFRKIINLVNRYGYDALVILGDLADSYPGMRKRPHQVRLLKQDLQLIKRAKLYLVPGNHDLTEQDGPATARRFRRVFGRPDRYVFKLAGKKFLAINTTLIRNRHRWPKRYAAQVAFMRQHRDADFVLGHHPAFRHRLTERDAYTNWPRTVRRELLGIFGPQARFLSGHTHEPFVNTVNRQQHLNPGSCCARRPQGRLSYGILEINGDKTEFRIVDLP